MDKEMKSMKEFDVYAHVPIDKVTKESYVSAIDLRWVKRWKTESELRMRFVARGFSRMMRNWTQTHCLPVPRLLSH